jgi:hypothetical protein
MKSFAIITLSGLLVFTSGAIAQAKPENQLAWYKWIKLGLTREQVQSKMGRPTACHTSEDGSGTQTFCEWGDDSLNGEITLWFQNGRVSRKNYSISESAGY